MYCIVVLILINNHFFLMNIFSHICLSLVLTLFIPVQWRWHNFCRLSISLSLTPSVCLYVCLSVCLSVFCCHLRRNSLKDLKKCLKFKYCLIWSRVFENLYVRRIYTYSPSFSSFPLFSCIFCFLVLGSRHLPKTFRRRVEGGG